MRPLRHANSNAVLITEAPLSAEEEFSNRRRRYLLMMFGRAVCVLGAVLVFHVSGWLAAAFLIAAAVLPWSAVLLANNKPARQAVRFRRYLPGDPAGPAQLGAAGQTPPGQRQHARDFEPGRDAPASAADPNGERVIDL